MTIDSMQMVITLPSWSRRMMSGLRMKTLETLQLWEDGKLTEDEVTELTDRIEVAANYIMRRASISVLGS